jgi:hypothetical protein
VTGILSCLPDKCAITWYGCNNKSNSSFRNKKYIFSLRDTEIYIAKI